MGPQLTSRKRKLPSKAVEESDDEIVDGLLDGALSQSEDDDEADESEPGEDDEEDEDDAVSDLDEEGSFKRALEGAEAEEDGDRPNYRIVEDANGGVRYVYDEIDPVYDSDDTDAQGGENTVGNIPLSFYDAYPHIGYTIDGKKLMRPAERKQALDSLLESIEIPKGWTGLTDPTTGLPLNLSQDELELLKRVQMNEIPEEGYDPYPVSVAP